MKTNNHLIMFPASKNFEVELKTLACEDYVNAHEVGMNRYQLLASQVRTYAMLASVTKSDVYTRAAKNTLEKLKKMMQEELTKTMSIGTMN